MLMPIQSGWMNEDKNLIMVRLEGKLGGAELLANDEATRQLLEAVPHPVDMILDYSRQIFFGSDYVEIAEKLKVFERKNLRLVILLGSEMAWQLYEAFSRQYGSFSFQAAYAASLEEAYALIEEARAGRKVFVRRPPFAGWN